MSIDPIIRQIVDRDCPVWMSNRAVIKRVISRFKNKWPTFRAYPRHTRKLIMLSCIEAHRANRLTFNNL